MLRELDVNRMPRHIAIIMDGNGRWAKKRALPRNLGHRAGAETMHKIALYCQKIGVQVLTVYAFSTENWKRAPDEIQGLMELLEKYIMRAKKELGDKNIRIMVSGDVSAFSASLQRGLDDVQKATQENTGAILNLALNYGGRAEIVRAVRALVEDAERGDISPLQIDEQAVAAKLYTADLPEPDMIIRPSGEMRLSNFLLWQCAYAELFFDDINWPDFTEKDLERMILEYQERDRRFGG